MTYILIFWICPPGNLVNGYHSLTFFVTPNFECQIKKEKKEQETKKKKGEVILKPL